jgi:hypothetical protein
MVMQSKTDATPVIELSAVEPQAKPVQPKNIKRFILVICGCTVSLLFWEGLCSSLVATYRLVSPNEHLALSGPSVQYDEQLGWVSIPNFDEKNYYAPGISLTTNSKGFRASQEFAQSVPAGRLRVICSGDSFTFGEGVGNDSTWCQLLESLNPHLQTVNMGESGYGADQMYLSYKRDGAALDHHIHIFAFITEDFRRMQLSSYVGYGKPILDLRSGNLVKENIPVPVQSHVLPWLERKRLLLREFQSVKLLGSLVGWALPAHDPFSSGPTDQQAQVIEKMLEDLQALEIQRNSVLVLVCLPTTLHDYEQRGPTPAWRAWIRSESMKRGIVFVDLVEEFHKLPVTMKDGMFIWPGSVHYFAEAPGHYNDEGNEWVARELYKRLIATPEVGDKLTAVREKVRSERGPQFAMVPERGEELDRAVSQKGSSR